MPQVKPNNPMRKTHSPILILLVMLFLAACAGPSTQAVTLTVRVVADGATTPVSLPAGSTVQQALEAAKITLSQTDRVSPAPFMALTESIDIVVTRVREEFETRQVIIPYERQELRNESLTAGETRLVQAGQNGLNEITIRHIYENGVETGNSVVSQTTLEEAVPEIVMIGVQSPFAPVSIPGKLAYLTGGNAWIMENSTSNRKPLITTGDLDGHIFALSPDGKWLLFSRTSDQPADKQINTLWVVSTTGQLPPVNLGVANVVHYAEWQPGQYYQISYSTVEPRSAAPGWQANNNVKLLEFRNGKPGRTFDVLGPNSGGIYGWWGTLFAWSPDGKLLAYSRPDEIGLVDPAGKTGQTPLLKITPLNTHSDWAWTPELEWSSDALSLFTVTHTASSGLVLPEESPNFDLGSIRLSSRSYTVSVAQTGMFAYPSVSSLREDNTGSTTYLVAYLQAIFPAQSATSRYRLSVMNANGSEPKLLLPAEGQPGLEPQKAAWAPKVMESGADLLSVIYEGNLWIVDAATGEPRQVTGDGLTVRIDWK